MVVEIIILLIAVAPIIDINVNATLSEDVEFRCAVSGFPTPTVTWFLEEAIIDNMPDNGITIDSMNSSTSINTTLRISAVMFSNSGRYRCSATLPQFPNIEVVSDTAVLVVRNSLTGTLVCNKIKMYCSVCLYLRILFN